MNQLCRYRALLAKGILLVAMHIYGILPLQAQGEPYSIAEYGHVPAVEGDFNGDGVKEYAWLYAAPSVEMGCVYEPCVGYVIFSNPNLKPIEVQSAVSGYLVNEGDLTGDGADEIGVLPMWFTSNYKFYHLFSYNRATATFEALIEPITIRLDMYLGDTWEETLQNLVEGVSSKPLVLLIHRVETDLEGRSSWVKERIVFRER
jgi:hypothetical protein